ncbi:hypothetical protein Tco_1434157, partial [Tanacetum coccineum]
MTTTHYPPEQLPATTVDSVASSPRSDHLDNNPRVYDDNIAQARV